MNTFRDSPFFKIYVSLGAFFVIVVTGMIGFIWIEDYTPIESLYMTVITLSTVGFTEVKPLSDSGRVFTIFLITVNLAVATFFIAQLSSYVFEGEFSRTYKFFKMKNSIKELKGHIIICGFGRNGREAAGIFYNSKRDFVVIEKSESRRDDLPFEVNFYLEDDATRDETLLQAGIENASALISTLPDDADNVFVVLTARALNPNLKIISRASHDSSVKKLKTAGANNVIMPDKIGGAHMATLITSPDVKEFIDLMATQNNEHFSIEEIESAITISLEDLNCWKQTGATVLGIKTSEGEFSLNPISKTVLRPGNRVIAMGAITQLKKVKELLG